MKQVIHGRITLSSTQMVEENLEMGGEKKMQRKEELEIKNRKKWITRRLMMVD